MFEFMAQDHTAGSGGIWGQLGFCLKQSTRLDSSPKQQQKQQSSSNVYRAHVGQSLDFSCQRQFLQLLRRITSSLKINLLGLPWWLTGKESSCWCRRLGSIPDPGRSHIALGRRATKPRAPQLLSLCPGAREPQRLTLCAAAIGACAPQQEMSPHREACSAHPGKRALWQCRRRTAAN